MYRKKGYDKNIDLFRCFAFLSDRGKVSLPSFPLWSTFLPARSFAGRALFPKKVRSHKAPDLFYMYPVGYALCKVNSGRMLPTSSCLWLRILGV